MPHLHRFFVPENTPDAGEFALPQDEAHHALRVVRLREGDAVALFDGTGRELHGAVSTCTKREVHVSIERAECHPFPAPTLTLAVAWLHKDKAIDEVVRRGTELGVHTFQFFRAAHSEQAPRLNAKWTRLAVEVCKQCGRLWLPNFSIAGNFAEVLASAAPCRLIAAMDHTPVPMASVLTGEDVTLLIGPEGDFTKEEVDNALAAGFRPVSLGETTFRTEVAAIVGATLVQYHLGRLGSRG
jgi:16S rRNA (uracil1498-N3)-methyltransferase